MKSNLIKTTALGLALFAVSDHPALARSPDLDQLKAATQQMQRTMEEMQKKIAEMEKEKEKGEAAAPAHSAIERTSLSYQILEMVAAGKDIGTASPAGTTASP